MSLKFSSYQIDAFLDEALPSDQMADVEKAMRDDEDLKEQIVTMMGKRDAGVHSLGAIWRRHRLSCPSREQLGSYLLGVLESAQADYIKFHVEVVGCRYCTASLEDLSQQASAADVSAQESRRTKYFQSSAGYLSNED